MVFATALNALKRGHKIKRHHWKGYWELEHCAYDGGDTEHMVMMHCFDNAVINLLDTKDVLYTLENIAADDWEIIDCEFEVEQIRDVCQEREREVEVDDNKTLEEYKSDVFDKMSDEKRLEWMYNLSQECNDYKDAYEKLYKEKHSPYKNLNDKYFMRISNALNKICKDYAEDIGKDWRELQKHYINEAKKNEN